MPADLITTDPAAQLQAVAAFVNSTTWTLAEAIAMADGLDLHRMVAVGERKMAPLNEIEPYGRSRRDNRKLGEFSVTLGDNLALLCTKAAPMMSTDQADAWIKVMTTALSDLPGWVAVEAAAMALHRPLRFLNEAEVEVRDAAAGIIARHSLSLRRLRTMIDERVRQAAACEARGAPVEDAEITAGQIRAMPPAFRRLGISAGFITQDQVDVALRDAAPMQEAA